MNTIFVFIIGFAAGIAVANAAVWWWIEHTEKDMNNDD